MKCPYHDCAKDFNPDWGSTDEPIYATLHSKEGDGLLILTFTCRFCLRKFHDIYRHKAVKKPNSSTVYSREELLFSFPSSKTKFDSKKIPAVVKESFNEAERCRSIGSLTGTGACLRKTVYSICDDKKVAGKDYREKIANLPVSGKYQQLLKQIKWLGDKITKPGIESYGLKDTDLAIEILPLIIDKLYAEDEKVESVEKILAKVRSNKLKTQ